MNNGVKWHTSCKLSHDARGSVCALCCGADCSLWKVLEGNVALIGGDYCGYWSILSTCEHVLAEARTFPPLELKAWHHDVSEPEVGLSAAECGAED